jgi:hypothetical protein
VLSGEGTHYECYAVFSNNRFIANALPEPDLKYFSSLRACGPFVIATYDRKVAGMYLLVEMTSPR